MPSFRSSVEPVLGTRLTLHVDAADAGVARRAEQAALDEADRLEAILTVHRTGSALRRWRRGELRAPPVEVVEVLRIAAAWHSRTGGAFNPCLGALMRRWRRAQEEQQLPAAGELAELAHRAAALPFAVEADRVVALGDCRVVDVQGVAKGWVVDRMVDAVIDVAGVSAVLVDLGGDVRHDRRDDSVTTIALEDPFAVADNAAPLTVVRLAGRAIATSGGGRRGWRIGGRWYGHLLDPSTGWPLADQAGATAVAATCADADAAASAGAVGGIAVVPDVAVLTVRLDGRCRRSEPWRRDVEELR